MCQLTQCQCELILALWQRGHIHGGGKPQPIFPDFEKAFKCSLGGKDGLIRTNQSPLSDLIAFGYIRVYDENVGSLILTEKAEDECAEIQDRYMQFLRQRG